MDIPACKSATKINVFLSGRDWWLSADAGPTSCLMDSQFPRRFSWTDDGESLALICPWSEQCTNLLIQLTAKCPIHKHSYSDTRRTSFGNRQFEPLKKGGVHFSKWKWKENQGSDQTLLNKDLV